MDQMETWKSVYAELNAIGEAHAGENSAFEEPSGARAIAASLGIDFDVIADFMAVDVLEERVPAMLRPYVGRVIIESLFYGAAFQRAKADAEAAPVVHKKPRPKPEPDGGNTYA